MSSKPSRIYKPRPISGFPELLPEQRLVEQQWIDSIRATFESFGFCSIETPSVEEVEVLAAKGGDADKEIYALRRLHAADDDRDARVALHYDLTVPLARYVAQHQGELVFPFKRYQIQRAWRGERPQEGRYREFYQCDIDIVGNETVSIHFDAELPEIIYEAFRRLEIERVSLHINNRKILEGFYRGLGIDDTVSAIRIVDKLDKIGPDGVRKAMTAELSLPAETIERCLALAGIRTPDGSFADAVARLGVEHELLASGLDELQFVMGHLRHIPPGLVFADLSIARGFDYYTGTVYEAKFVDYPGFPSICSGGRYDNLVGAFSGKRLPGVGMSIGLTRIFQKLLKEGRIRAECKSPTEVLVVFVPGRERDEITDTARRLRARGLKVEMYHEPAKLDTQLRYAGRKGIPFVWFAPFAEGQAHEVKDMRSGTQAPADPAMWTPPAA